MLIIIIREWGTNCRISRSLDLIVARIGKNASSQPHSKRESEKKKPENGITICSFFFLFPRETLQKNPERIATKILTWSSSEYIKRILRKGFLGVRYFELQSGLVAPRAYFSTLTLPELK